MKLIVVHYHLRPGGIRRVIEMAVPALVQSLQPKIEAVWLISGAAAEPAWRDRFVTQMPGTPLHEFSDPALGYFSEWNGSAADHRKAVWKAVDRALELVAGPALVWMHNSSVARNITFTRALTARSGTRGWPLLFHQHDWWFDNRWARWHEMKRTGILRTDEAAAVLFPPGDHVRHLTINRADADLLKRHLGSAATCLPNPIDAPVPVTAERTQSARDWLQERIGAVPAWILPCRLLRRKNVAEALLLTRLLRPGAWLVTTGGASSQDEQAYATRLQNAAMEKKWPLRLSVLAGGESEAPRVDELIAASEAVVLTSLQEGFGLPFLEALEARRPLLARRLSNISPDLESFGLTFPQLYHEIMVDPALFDWTSERARQRALFAHWKTALPLSVRPWAGKTALLQVGLAEETPVPFSKLTLTAQLEVLAHADEILWNAFEPLNSFLAPWRAAAETGSLGLASGLEAAREVLSTACYAERFAQALRQPGAISCHTSVASALQAEFMQERLQAENLLPSALEPRDMKVRAAIFDVYKTLMQVGPPPADAPERWRALCRKTFGRTVKVSLEEFTAIVRRIVLREHRTAHEVGINFPEICWPQVVAEALREIRHLDETERLEFFLEHNRLLRTLTLMPGIAEVLRFCVEAKLTLGIASNAQNYSLPELDEVLQPEGLSLESFDPHLRFWSFENGFSKPNPHVFRMLGARLWARGIPLGAILMVGDRLDNDIRPARVQGWQTWHLTPHPAAEPDAGDLGALLAFLQAQHAGATVSLPSKA